MTVAAGGRRAICVTAVGCLLVLSVVDSSRYFAPTVQPALIYEPVSPGALVPAQQFVGAPPAQQVYLVPQSEQPGSAPSAVSLLACCAIFGVSFRVASALLSGSVNSGRNAKPVKMTATLSRPKGQIPFRSQAKGVASQKFVLPELEGIGDFDLPEGADEYSSFQEMLLGNEMPQLERGTVVKGRVASITRNNVGMVDIGRKSECMITFEEATLVGEEKKNLSEILTVGEEYEFQVLGGNNGGVNDLNVALTRRPLLAEKAWERVEAFAKDGPTFMVKVLRANQGGLIVTHPELGGLTGFLPGSMIVNRVDDNETLVGTEIEVKFLQADKEEQRIIVSNRAAVQDKALQNIKENDLVEGTVAAIMNFGVFVDVQGMRGMIHVSQVSGLFVDPALMEELFPIGSTIKCVAMKTDFAKGKLALSTRILETTAGEMRVDPQRVYDGAEERHKQLKEQWRLEQEAREKERKELESQIMDLTMSVFDNDNDGEKSEAGEEAAIAA